MKRILILPTLLISLFAYSQSFNKMFTLGTGNNLTEQAFTGVELTNGNFLIGVNNYILCLAPNGDSLWSKKFNVDGVDKLFLDKSQKLRMVYRRGRFHIMELNPLNGDSIGNKSVPGLVMASGYTLHDIKELADGRYVMAFRWGSGDGGEVSCFVPGASSVAWKADYAGISYAPKSICVHDSLITIAGYKRRPTGSRADLHLIQLSNTNSQKWTRSIDRNASLVDRLVGIQRNSAGEFLVATSLGVGSNLKAGIAKFSSNGDSLGFNYLNSHNGNENANSLAYSLEPGAGGYIASGHIALNIKDSFDNNVTVHYMSVFHVSESGIITKYAMFNKNELYRIGTSSSDGTVCIGAGAFYTSDLNYLVYGEGGMLKPNPNYPEYFESKRRSYVVKNNQFITIATGLNSLHTKPDLSATLFPNPAVDAIKTNLEGLGQIEIFDQHGKLIQTSNEVNLKDEIQISDLTPGIYFIRIQRGDDVYHSRFLKRN